MTDVRHATNAGYLAGCREVCCRNAHAKYRRDLRARHYLAGVDSLRVDALGTRRRLQALAALGWPTEWIDSSIGRRRGYTSNILSSRQTVLKSTADLIDSAYESLSMSVPPTDTLPRRQVVSRTRNLAARRGWVPPLAWDDIDDPHELPATYILADLRIDKTSTASHADEVTVERVLAGEWRTPTTKADRVEVVARWRAQGRSLAELGRRTGWKPERYYTPGEDAA